MSKIENDPTPTPDPNDRPDPTPADFDTALSCDKCDRCVEKTEELLELAEQRKLVDTNEKDTEILDLIINFRHYYDQLPEKDRTYASWQDLIDSTAIHYEAELSGEDCTEDCERHGHLFTDPDPEEEAP